MKQIHLNRFCFHLARAIGGPTAQQAQLHLGKLIASVLPILKVKSKRRPVVLVTYRATSGWPSKLIWSWATVHAAHAHTSHLPHVPPSFPCMPFLFNIACQKNVLSLSYYLHFKNRLHHCIIRDKTNKIRPH